MGVTWLLVACTDAPSADSSPWLEGDATHPTPELSTDELQATVQDIVDVLFELNAQEIFERYDAWIEQGDDSCPLWSERELYEIWTASCTTDSGVQISGTGTSVRESGEEGSYQVDSRSLELAASFTSADETLTIEGDVEGSVKAWIGDEATAHTLYTSALVGRFVGSGTDTWLDDGWTFDLWLKARDEGGERSALAEGSIAGLDGGIEAVSLENFSHTSASGCPAEPGGHLALRDTTGSWYKLEFAGDQDAWGQLDADHPGCDGCGELSYAGVVIGELCIDPTPLTAWKGSPW